MTTNIKFGTDGWRGVIADDYTFENVRRVGNAIAHYVHENEDAAKGLVVGYDTRFSSRAFAEAISEVLAAAGIVVHLSDDYTPTPALSYAVVNLGAAGGVMITSSHNPFNWNGVKYKAGYGGSATPAIIKAIESALDAPPIERPGGRVSSADFKTPYIAAVKKFVDLDAIKKAGFKFAVDAMYGSGRGVLKQIFAENGIDHIEIRGEINPPFPGINPEPILPHVALSAGDCRSRALPGRNGYRWRRRPAGRGRRRRQFRRLAQDLLGDPGVAAEAQAMAGRSGARLQYHAHDRPHLAPSTGARCTSAASASSTSATSCWSATS